MTTAADRRVDAMNYPHTHQVDQVDAYHGIAVADPYRWLEDEADPRRPPWIAAQNRATTAYLGSLPLRMELRRRYTELLQYPRYYGFVRRGLWLFFAKNEGLDRQLRFFGQQGLGSAPILLIDPTELASDGTVRVTVAAPSKDARYLAYGLSRGGSDWEEYRVKDMATRQDLPDRLSWVKYSSIAWYGAGFYYSRYPVPADKARLLSERSENHQVWYHRVGSPQSADTLVYEDRTQPLRLNAVATTPDEHVAVLTIRDYAGGHPGQALWLLTSGPHGGELRPLVTSFSDEYRIVDAEGARLLVLTNYRAEQWRLVLIDPTNPSPRHWQEVVPEEADALEAVMPVGDELFLTYRTHGAHRLCVCDRAGRGKRDVALPGMGVTQVASGTRHDTDALWTYSSVTTAPTIYRYDRAMRVSTVLVRPNAAFTSDDYETYRVFYASKDGTRVPMFVTCRKGLRCDGSHALLLQGYGGNGISMGPRFDPFLVALLERGVVCAMACLRGGGEYGDAWHRAGWRECKQNVFDDCIAAAEWLVAHGYTKSDRLAIAGSSNGGLLVGAVMTQRPDLFQVALPDVGVMDMLRFQHFTIGAAWAAEYGTSDDPAMFRILRSYSPLHNIQSGIRYPATLVTTSEHDDHVVPAHSFKFVATLQEKGASPGPYLIRIDAQSGHGPVSLTKALDERADAYAFLLAQMPGYRADGVGDTET